ncbi:hypothetical protein GCM10011579_060200 [Streptomyces albiflavescens]|uniref:Uncharacterized protein n=1 Tax=Streptomyces albiflavescens TaxID=1623582 RepID=A0A917Y8F2_9ACTN|nr:hypothetical protein [Streptomyces albiflavescens]GGN77710.1 hypothetical protein GCM10011579_060200 [Streptomyces albiflavescens]
MRYLVESFAVGALKRGQGIEQFLGRSATENLAGVWWVSIEPTKRGFVVTLHAVEDVGGEHFCDLLEFPPLDPDYEFGQELGAVQEPLAAMALAEDPGLMPDHVQSVHAFSVLKGGRPTHT